MEDSILSSPWHIRRSIQVFICHGIRLRLHRPRRVLEQIKGISEQKATKILAEGPSQPPPSPSTISLNPSLPCSLQTRPHGLHHRYRNAPTPLRTHLHHHRLKTTRYLARRWHRNGLCHRDLRRISDRKIPNLSYARRHLSAAI